MRSDKTDLSFPATILLVTTAIRSR